MEMKTIIEEWEDVGLPSPPEVKRVNINPGETGLLLLDIQTQNCNNERRPRCVDRLPYLEKLLMMIRTNHIPVFYSITSSAQESDIREEVKPRKEDPIVKSGVDKFYNTNLEDILRERGVKTLIITGTAAHGAVLHTATAAVLRGFHIIIPVDGLSAGEPYAEQYTLWHIAHAPGTCRNATITRTDWIEVE
ncbi:MAG: cysteine hydrolase [Theionarchaea archaeon]|nr:cysteine hydrolase [Theionarchaea archaeon]